MNVSELIERLRTHWESQREAREADAQYDACCVDLGDEAADALEAQAREIERLCEQLRLTNIDQFNAESRLAAAERDAERYRYLRDATGWSIQQWLGLRGVWTEYLSGKNLDDAIDAAREGGK